MNKYWICSNISLFIQKEEICVLYALNGSKISKQISPQTFLILKWVFLLFIVFFVYPLLPSVTHWLTTAFVAKNVHWQSIFGNYFFIKLCEIAIKFLKETLLYPKISRSTAFLLMFLATSVKKITGKVVQCLSNTVGATTLHRVLCLQFNDMLLVCSSQLIGIRQHYRIKARMDIDGMQVRRG